MSQNNKNCTSCEYFSPNQCNRFPPMIYKFGDQTAKHPQVDPNDYCGEFKLKESLKPVFVEVKLAKNVKKGNKFNQ